MSGYLSNILTQTTSRYNSLRRTLLSNEDDGDTEDDSHISRVLRAYYTEKGRPFPPWLPPDPNERKTPAAQSYGQQASGYFNRQYGNVTNNNPTSQRSSLSELWDPPSAPPNNAPIQPQSLRNARRPVAPAPTSNPGYLAPTQAQPLPSQRAGSYQKVSVQRSGMPGDVGAPAGTGGTAQDRLKAKLWGAGGRGGSPGPGSQSSSPTPYDQQPRGGNPYDTGGGRRW